MTLSNLPSNDKFTIVDVRTAVEVEAIAVKRVIHIPMHDILERFEEFKTLKKPIIAFCRSGNRSGWVADILTDKGIEKIFNGGSVEDIEKLLK